MSRLIGIVGLTLCVGIFLASPRCWCAEVGMSSPGTDDYPDGGMRYFGEVGREGRLTCIAVDSLHGYAYIGTRTKPGRIVKVALGGGTTPPRRVTSIKLEEGEDNLRAAVIDAANGYAYFVTGTIPGQIVKIAVGNGDSAPVRIGALSFAAPEDVPGCAVIDAANGFAYFGTLTATPQVIKVALGAGDTLPTRVSSVLLPVGNGPLYCADIDTVHGYAYFGSRTEPGVVTKVRLESGDTEPTYIGSLVLPVGVDNLLCGAINVATGYGYFATETAPGRVIKVGLGAGDAVPFWTDSVLLGAGEDYPSSMVIDPTKGQACLGTNTSPGSIVKVGLGAGAAAPARLSATTMQPGENSLVCAWALPSMGYAWFGGDTTPGRVVKVALEDLATAPTRVGGVSLACGDDSYSCALYDPGTGYAYLGHADNPAVTKVWIGNGPHAPVRVGAVHFPVHADYDITCGVIDSIGGYAYFGSTRVPAIVMKSSLGTGSSLPAFCGSCTLPEGQLTCGVLDRDRGYVCFANSSSVMKLSMGLGSFPPLYICMADVPETDLEVAMNDPSTRCAWFARGLGSGAVVKMDLGEGADPPIRIGALDSSEYSLNCVAFDQANSTAYLGTSTAPGKVVRIGALTGGATLPTFDGSITLNTGEDHLRSAMADGASAWFGTLVPDPGKLIKVHLDPSGSPWMERTGSFTLPVGEKEVYGSVMDPVTGLGIVATGSEPANIIKVSVSQKGFIKATRCTLTEPAIVDEVRWYSHRPEGSVRLAIYDNSNPRELLWESMGVVNTTSNDFVAVPISSGAPSALNLHPGTYWLAWQVNTTANVASYTEGAEGDGFFLLQPYGSFPTSIAADQTSGTNEIWSHYLSYEPAAVMHESQDELFDTDVSNPVPGGKDGWTPFSAYQAGQVTDYDSSHTALRITISSGTGQPRINGWMTGNSEWYPYSLVGTEHYVRGKFYVFRTGQTDKYDLNQVPNMRLRLSTRFAVSSVLEVFNHLTGDTAGTEAGIDIMPSYDSSYPSIYRVDLDPVDVPALGSGEEGISRGFEAYSLEDQENGALELAESVIGIYPSWVVPDSGPEVLGETVYQCSPSDAGDLRVINSATDGPFLRKFALLAPGVAGPELPLDGLTDPQYSESSGGIVMHCTKVTSSVLGIVVREFTELGENSVRFRVEPGRQYKLRFHVRSSASSNTNAQMRMRARSLKFMWSQKLEVGGAYGAGNINNMIAQQALPGNGCQNPDQLTPGEPGGWYTLLMHTPMTQDIQFSQPCIDAQPGPGSSEASIRDIKFGFDLIDTLSGSSLSHQEVGSFQLDRVEMRSYSVVAD